MTGLTRRACILCLAAVFGGTIWASPKAAARSNFDGAWSVVVITDSGMCDRTYRYGIQIINGRVRYDGDPSVNIGGYVDAKGRVTVQVRSGDQMASGSGRLFREAGSGRWNGGSQTQQCSGHWEADRLT
jgi:hypothetical protein